MWVIKQNKDKKDAIAIEYNMKKVLCSAEKNSVIWAEQFGWTERLVGHYYPRAQAVVNTP